MNYRKNMFALLVAGTLITGCGGSGTDISGNSSGSSTNSSGSGSTATTSSYSITSILKACTDSTNELTCVETNILPTTGVGILEFYLKDSKGIALDNQIVTAVVTKGSVSPDSQLTDKNGYAKFYITAPSSATEGTGKITLTYTDDNAVSKVSSTNFQFTPSITSSSSYKLSLSLKSCTDPSDSSTCVDASKLPTNKTSVVEATLTGSTGTAIPDAIISASTTVGSLQPGDKQLTDSAGKVKFILLPGSLSASVAGTVSIASTVTNSDGSTSSTAAAKNFQFGATNLNLKLTSDISAGLQPGSVALLTAQVTQTDENSVTTPYTTPVQITLSSPCASNAKAKLDTSVTTDASGFATATYVGLTNTAVCGVSDRITAAISGVSQNAYVDINNLATKASSIQAAIPVPKVIYVKGSGKGETSTIVFTLIDDKGLPLSGQRLDFSFGGISSVPSGKYSDYTLSPNYDPITRTSYASTNSSGQASVTVTAGSVPVPLRVIASLHDNSEIRAASPQIGVGIGYPDENSFSFSADKYNIEGWEFDGTEATITFHLSDRFNNPVPDGTLVYLTTEGGSIKGNLASGDGDVTGLCSTVAGVCSATLTSTSPRPNDGRVTVLAYVEGEESFFDVDGNGLYDLSVGDIKGADVGEPFLDVNVDDQASSLIADVDGFIVNVDSPVDLDYDGIRNAGNEIYNGLACNDATGTECVRNNVQLFHNAEFIFTGINPHNGASPALPTTIQLCVKRQAVDVAEYDSWTGIICAQSADPSTQARDVANRMAFIWETVTAATINLTANQNVLVSDANGATVSLGNDDSGAPILEKYTPPNARVVFVPEYVMSEGTINPIPATSAISVTTTNGGEIQPIGRNWSGGYPSTTRAFSYVFLIGQEETGNKKSSGTLKIGMTSPKGSAFTKSFTVLDSQ
jgi:hypothetical protein